jgi:twitching motility protein PilT
MVRAGGEIVPIEHEALDPDVTRRLLLELLTDSQRQEFERQRYLDFSYEVPGVARLRCSLYLQTKGIAGAFRLLPSSIPGVDQLGLPPHVVELGALSKGLVLVTGPPGSGKSTTLAALIEHVNATQRRHIMTIEDPVEFVFNNKQCLIHQREVGQQANSFADALRSALRADTNIIMVGEMRDLETMSLAITAAETGQLVFGTLHTPSAAQTVERIIDSFGGERQQQVRTMLSESLRGVIAQRLLRRADGQGRVLAVEILIGTTAVGAMIRDRKTFQIPSIMQTSRNLGMQLMDDHLIDLVQAGVITRDDALGCATDQKTVRNRIERDGGGSTVTVAGRPLREAPGGPGGDGASEERPAA